MRKQVKLMTVILLSSAALLSGCGSSINAKLLTKNLNTSSVKEDYCITEYQAVADFGYELLRQNQQENNPILSPVSAYLALSMVGSGSNGSTKEEFDTLLGQESEALSALMLQSLPQDSKKIKLALADSAWVNDNFEADKDWLSKVANVYAGEVYQANLSTETTRKDINQWVKDNTNGLIPSVLEEPLDEDTLLVLINSLYFKGDWKKEFKKSNTYQEDFRLENDSLVAVDMMHQKLDCKYFQADTFEGVMLPYCEENFVFVAIKPSNQAEVRTLLSSLNYEMVSEILRNSQTGEVNLTLPKFELTFDCTLNESLKKMGLITAFSPDAADFSGLGRNKSEAEIYLDLVQQKVYILLDESGTKAAAVTMIVANKSSAMEPISIRFDKPFLYIIMDARTQIPIFIGIMDYPVQF